MSSCGNFTLVLPGPPPSGRRFKSWDLSTALERQMALYTLPCGICFLCRQNKSKELALRCGLESFGRDSMFLTLTYDESQPGYINCLDYKHIQDFKKRVQRFASYHKKLDGIKFFNVHEFGKNKKKHWHLLCFGFRYDDLEPRWPGDSSFVSKELSGHWPFGHHLVGAVESASSMYVSGYMEKEFLLGHEKSTYSSKSNHRALGRDWFLDNYRSVLGNGYVSFESKKHPIPRYFLKLAHKHFCHFYDPSYFFDKPPLGGQPGIKRRYAPFKDGEPNRELANLFWNLKEQRKEVFKENMDIFDREYRYAESVDTDFSRQLSNALYELKKKEIKDF